MDFSYSSKVVGLERQLIVFMEEYVVPNEALYEGRLNE